MVTGTCLSPYNKSGMNDYFYGMLRQLFFLFWHCKLLDLKNIPRQGPAVFVSNHLGSFAPVAFLSAYPGRLYPWVEHQVTDWKLCSEYLRKDFIEPELHLKPPLSHFLGWLISLPCVMLMKAIEAVPVCQKSMKLVSTWKRSIELLKKDQSLAIFPENDSLPFNEVMNELDDGFIGLAPIYYEKTGRILSFIPVAVHKTVKAIKIGRPISYNPKNAFSSERERIKAALQADITEMYPSFR